MPMFGGFSIGRWFGFPIRIDYSWFVLIALIVWIFSSVEFPRQLPGYSDAAYLVMGVAAALFFFLSLLLHELAHSVMARSRGIPVQGITLFIFGGVAQTTMEAKRPVDEFLLTVVGPLASFAIAAVFWALGDLTARAGVVPAVGEVAKYLAFLNFVLAVFNLVPGFPLDGGRLFRAAVWQLTGNLQRATRWATIGGRLFGYFLIAAGVWAFLSGRQINGLWLAFIGWFLASAASTSYRQFLLMRAISGVPVARVLRPTGTAVTPGMSAAQLAELFVARSSATALTVVEEGRVVGLVSLDDLAALPAARRAKTRVADLMTKIEDVPQVGPFETLDHVVVALQAAETERLLVVEGGRILGVVTLDDIGEWVQRARKLGMDRPTSGADAQPTPGAPSTPMEEPLTLERGPSESARSAERG